MICRVIRFYIYIIIYCTYMYSAQWEFLATYWFSGGIRTLAETREIRKKRKDWLVAGAAPGLYIE
jgi:hypothetical protein